MGNFSVDSIEIIRFNTVGVEEFQKFLLEVFILEEKGYIIFGYVFEMGISLLYRFVKMWNIALKSSRGGFKVIVVKFRLRTADFVGKFFHEGFEHEFQIFFISLHWGQELELLEFREKLFIILNVFRSKTDWVLALSLEDLKNKLPLNWI